jgi:hypothetical protein
VHQSEGTLGLRPRRDQNRLSYLWDSPSRSLPMWGPNVPHVFSSRLCSHRGTPSSKDRSP